MFDRISYTWSLMGASWNVLRRDKGLILFPLCSGACCIIVMLSFIFPMILWHPVRVQSQQDQIHNIIFYALLFAFYFCNYFVITFFNTAIIACAVSRLAGGEPSIAGGFREAFARIHLIIGWALVSATVGLALRLVAERSKIVGRIVVGLLGVAWSIATYLAVPVMVVENKGPIAAIKESTRLLTDSWGTRIAGRFSFGLIFLLLAIPGMILMVLAIFTIGPSHSFVLPGILFAMAVAYFVFLSLVSSALQSIFQAAVYLYTQDALLPAKDPQSFGFPVELIRPAMIAQ